MSFRSRLLICQPGPSLSYAVMTHQFEGLTVAMAAWLARWETAQDPGSGQTIR